MTPPRRKNPPNAAVTPRKSLSRGCPEQNPKNRDAHLFMPKDSEQPASWRAFTKPPSRRAQPEEPVAIDFGARAQDFLKRITPLSADLAAHGRTRTLALQKLHRICLAEVAPSKTGTPWPPSSSPSPNTATRSAPWTPITWSCAQEKCVPDSASAILRSNARTRRNPRP